MNWNHLNDKHFLPLIIYKSWSVILQAITFCDALNFFTTYKLSCRIRPIGDAVYVISKEFSDVNEAATQEQKSASHRVQFKQNSWHPTAKEIQFDALIIYRGGHFSNELRKLGLGLLHTTHLFAWVFQVIWIIFYWLTLIAKFCRMLWKREKP